MEAELTGDPIAGLVGRNEECHEQPELDQQ
jgi:hypothetical protein